MFTTQTIETIIPFAKIKSFSSRFPKHLDNNQNKNARTMIFFDWHENTWEYASKEEELLIKSNSNNFSGFYNSI